MNSASIQNILRSPLLAVVPVALLMLGGKEPTVPSSGSTVESPTTAQHTATVPTDARIVPVSGGDAILEAFWDSNLGAWPKWKFTNEEPKTDAVQSWSLVTLNWTAKRVGEGPSLKRIYAGSGVRLASYSQLVLSAGVKKGAQVTLHAETDAGPVTKNFVSEASYTDQFVMPLPGAKFLTEVHITFGAAAQGPEKANLVWLGLRDPQLADIETIRWQHFNEQPLDLFLRSVPEPANEAPLYHLLSSAEGFEAAKKSTAATQARPLRIKSQITLEPHLVGAANQNLFGRRTTKTCPLYRTFINTRENGTTETIGLAEAAQKAAILGDSQALREVAKAAIQIALIPHWDVDFITKFHDSSWDQRSFVQAQVCEALAISLDLAGAWMTPAAKTLILRRLAEDGIGNINYVVWKYPYIFSCNQLPVFSVGRLAAHSLLEKQTGWGHIKPYTDLAFAELNESLAQNFLSDGGFPEGSGYLAYTLDNALPALAIYANAREKSFGELLPPLLGKTDNYISALQTTETGRPTQLILVGDAQGGPFAPLSASVLSVMSKIRPGGASARMLARLKPNQHLGLKLWALPSPDVNGIDPEGFDPFVTLPENGITASTRKVGDFLSKLVVIGGPARAGHNHEDRGSFVLEFAGETFAADPGGMNYSDPMVQMLKYAQSHNMLVPFVRSSDRPAAQNPASVAVIPAASGDATSFHATIDPAVLWPGFYQKWVRTFTSPTAGEITIIDEYALSKGDGVDFLWHTPLPVRKDNGQVIITGTRGRAIITPPVGSTVEITPSRKLGMREIATIRFRREAKSGSLEAKVHLEPIE